MICDTLVNTDTRLLTGYASTGVSNTRPADRMRPSKQFQNSASSVL